MRIEGFNPVPRVVLKLHLDIVWNLVVKDLPNLDYTVSFPTALKRHQI